MLKSMLKCEAKKKTLENRYLWETYRCLYNFSPVMKAPQKKLLCFILISVIPLKHKVKFLQNVFCIIEGTRACKLSSDMKQKRPVSNSDPLPVLTPFWLQSHRKSYHDRVKQSS